MNNLLFNGSTDKNICVWKRDESGVHICLSVLTGHTEPVKSIAVEESDEADDQNHDPYFGKGNQRWIVYMGSLDKCICASGGRQQTLHVTSPVFF